MELLLASVAQVHKATWRTVPGRRGPIRLFLPLQLIDFALFHRLNSPTVPTARRRQFLRRYSILRSVLHQLLIELIIHTANALRQNRAYGPRGLHLTDFSIECCVAIVFRILWIRL